MRLSLRSLPGLATCSVLLGILAAPAGAIPVRYDFTSPAPPAADGFGIYSSTAIDGYYIYESTTLGVPVGGFLEPAAEYTGGLLEIVLRANGVPLDIGTVVSEILQIRDGQDFTEEDAISLRVETTTHSIRITGFEFADSPFIVGTDIPESFGEPFMRGSVSIEGPALNDLYSYDSSFGGPPVTITATVVPEPGAALLFAVSLALLRPYIRRRR